MRDHLFPTYHVRPPSGFLNDPNGPILVDGTLHLYFQSRPTTNTDVPVQWGHATTDDFVTWLLHRPAMVPQPDGPDRDGCFSGNTVRDGEQIQAFYSGYVQGEPFQSILTAISDDGGYSFGPPTPAVEDPADHEGVVMFRDPFVWHDESGWNMVVGSERTGEMAAVRLYQSPDLREWKFVDDLAAQVRTTAKGVDTGAGWECPQVVGIDGAETLIVSAWSQLGGSGAVLSVDPNNPKSIDTVDFGTNFYAASVLRESPYGPVMFGWLTEGTDPSAWHSRGWAGVISLPRMISRAHDGSLRSDPIPALDGLRDKDGIPADGATTGAAFELQIPHVTGKVLVRYGATEWLELDVSIEQNTMTLNRDHASTDPSSHRGIAVATDAFDTSRHDYAARVFIDGSVVEVFTSAGRSLSSRVYPKSAPPWTLQAPAGATVYALTSTEPHLGE